MKKLREIVAVFTLMAGGVSWAVAQAQAFDGTNGWLHKPDDTNTNDWRAMPLTALDNARDPRKGKKPVTVIRGTQSEVVYLNLSITNAVLTPKIEHQAK